MADPPIVCSLSPEALAARRGNLLPGLAQRADEVEPLGNGYRLRFPADTELLRAIVDVIEAERHCCQFLRFELDVPPASGPISLTVTGPDGAGEMLKALLG